MFQAKIGRGMGGEKDKFEQNMLESCLYFIWKNSETSFLEKDGVWILEPYPKLR
jgi:hypothetical protein